MNIFICLLYLLIVFITSIGIYIYFIKQYKKEKPNLPFKYWFTTHGGYEYTFMVSTFWIATIPVLLFNLMIDTIGKYIRNYYNVE